MNQNFPLQLKSAVEERLHRLNSRLRGSGRSLDLTVGAEDREFDTLLNLRSWEPLSHFGERASLVIPKPRQNEFGNWVIGDRNDRALCPFMLVVDGQPRHANYHQLVWHFIFENLEELYPAQGKRNHLDKILWGFTNKRGKLTTSLCQRFLNLNIFNALPLSGTPMQDWAMNHRLMVFDPVFDKLRPDEKLAYQKRKNELLFPWASIGLSDGAAATKNYILQEDLKRYTAFGLRHHNPIRNLYSTLGMKGPDQPWVVSSSAMKLEGKGVKRGGWNWMTAFLDLPDNFEDQILVSKRHVDKEVSYQRSYIIYGEETVLVGDTLSKGNIVGVNEDGSPVLFDVDCDRAQVIECKEGSVPFDGQDQPVRIVTLDVVFRFRDGIKITNQHGNKGIVRLMDLGKVYNGQKEVDLDVIVSARSVQKRRNFGQILEALSTLISENICRDGTRVVVEDKAEVTTEQVVAALEKNGLNPDGCCKVETPWGEFRTLCGYVHWGVTKTPEEQLWQGQDTWVKNQRGLRTRGNKVSTIELKALTTLLGPGSKVVREILQHQQGVEEARELLDVLQGMRGKYRPELPTVKAGAFVYLPSGLGTFHAEERLAGTIADEELYPNGCYLQLPIRLRVGLPYNRQKGEIEEGLADGNPYRNPEYSYFETEKLMVPSFALRQPWRHPTGKFGLSEIATQLNQIIESIDRLAHGEIKPEQLSGLVYRYYHNLSRSLSLKSGKLSNYLMAVRYPWSSKATAVLGDADLPKNWIEIHRDMAHDLNVGDGDYVLVERFPCLGFMSTRIQRVRVTDDPQCKYVIRVSGNSLVSMNLDFDGDVIYVMSFHSEGAKRELQQNFHLPHPRIGKILKQMNDRKKPMTRTMTLQEMKLRSFAPMAPKQHADLNERSLAVKAYTGPVIALCYSLMRIVEGNISYTDREAHANIEVFLDKVGNSVFSQKHGTRSLREECVEAVCLADLDALLELGFPEKESYQLCEIIRRRAHQVGVRTKAELHAHYRRHVEEGRSHIINTIVRNQHRRYFATRANLHPLDLLDHLDSSANDLVGFLIERGLREAPRQELRAEGVSM